MSQQTSAPPASRGRVVPPGSAAAPTRVVSGRVLPPTGVTSSRRGPVAALRGLFTGSPGRLRLVATVTALAAAVFGVLGANSLWSSASALGRADLNTTQVVRVQSISSDLVSADAAATNAFLVGGLEPPAQRADYDAAIARVATTIAEAATAQPADGDALGALNAQVQQYTSLVEQARADNRQGLPVGATYLGSASSGLRAGAFPIVKNLVDANDARQAIEFRNSSDSLVLALSAAIALVVLVLAMIWLARRSHRYLNAPLSVGLVLVVLALVVGALGLGSAGTAVTTARDTSVRATLDLATIRSSAYDAKAQESLTLIYRGSGAAYEAAWKADSDTLTGLLASLGTPLGDPAVATTLATQWQAYVSLHEAIRAADDGGGWDRAVALAGATTSASANAAFATFSASIAHQLDVEQQAASRALTAPRLRTTVLGWVLLVLCVGAAALALRGFAQRIEEYR